MTTPLVSVCVPNLNTRPFLEERMETLLAQTLDDYEIVISDNYSSDGAWEFFGKFKDNPKVRLSQAPRRGMYANWNECLRRARGRYLYMATSDDTCAPPTLERLVALLERRPELKIAVCGLQVIDEEGRSVPKIEELPYRQFYGEWVNIPSIRPGRTEFLMHACFGTVWYSMTSVLFHRDVLERTGLFRTDLASHADEEWALRAALASDIAFIPDRLATWRFHNAQGTPHRMTTRSARHVMNALRTVVHDGTSGIPAAWKEVPHWDDLLMAARRADYLASYRLWRRAAVDYPRFFIEGTWDALRREPRLLLRQATRLFKWSPDFAVDRQALARKFIETFHAPWPPREF